MGKAVTLVPLKKPQRMSEKGPEIWERMEVKLKRYHWLGGTETDGEGGGPVMLVKLTLLPVPVKQSIWGE